MIVVVADTSGLLAAFDRAAPVRAAAAAALDTAGTVVMTSALLAEVDHVGRRELGRPAAMRLLDWLADRARSGRLVLVGTSGDELATAQRIRRQYADLQLDLADALTVVAAATYETNVILTLDRRDLRAVRPLTHHGAFRLLPDDS